MTTLLYYCYIVYIRINERGARFVEKIIINEKENTVTFMVPRHNDVEHSEVRNDFNLVR